MVIRLHLVSKRRNLEYFECNTHRIIVIIGVAVPAAVNNIIFSSISACEGFWFINIYIYICIHNTCRVVYMVFSI